MSEKKDSNWMQTLWRPMMGWMYMLICLLDMAVFPVLWALWQGLNHVPITQWNPLTLQGAGLFHIAMGAVLGISAFGRTQEKLAGTAANPTATESISMNTTNMSGVPQGMGNMNNNMGGGFNNNTSGGFGSNSFGSPPTGFGQPTGFGTPTPAFGSTALGGNTMSATPAFGSTTTGAFGSGTPTTSTGFGQTSTYTPPAPAPVTGQVAATSTGKPAPVPAPDPEL